MAPCSLGDLYESAVDVLQPSFQKELLLQFFSGYDLTVDACGSNKQRKDKQSAEKSAGKPYPPTPSAIDLPDS